MTYTTKAAFLVRHRWTWVKWRHAEPNSHAAITSKARELNADAWDFGNADHYPTDQFPVTR